MLLPRLATHWWLLRECRDLDSWRTLRGRPRPGPGNLRIRLRSLAPALLARRDTSDTRVIWEIFHDGEYESPASDRFRTVIDCGANAGIFLAYLLRRSTGGPEALRKYIGVEPDPESFAFLADQVRALGLEDRCTLLQAAVSDADGPLRFDTSVESWSRRITPIGRATVDGLCIHSILDRAGLDQADLLKLDIEGSEARVMPTISKWAGRIRCIVCELHDGLGFGWFSSVVSEHGFRAFKPGSLFAAHPGAVRLDCLDSFGLRDR